MQHLQQCDQTERGKLLWWEQREKENAENVRETSLHRERKWSGGKESAGASVLCASRQKQADKNLKPKGRGGG